MKRLMAFAVPALLVCSAVFAEDPVNDFDLSSVNTAATAMGTSLKGTLTGYVLPALLGVLGALFAIKVLPRILSWIGGKR